TGRRGGPGPLPNVPPGAVPRLGPPRSIASLGEQTMDTADRALAPALAADARADTLRATLTAELTVPQQRLLAELTLEQELASYDRAVAMRAALVEGLAAHLPGLAPAIHALAAHLDEEEDQPPA